MSGTSTRSRRGWTLSDEEAQTLLASARRAFFVMVGILAVLWIIQIINVADGYRLTAGYGVTPRAVGSLPYLLTAPFLHVSWTHIESNSGPLFIFGFLAAYRGIARFIALTVIVILTSGFAAWFFGPQHSVEAGASGVIFGYFGYIIVRGLFDRRAIDVLIGAVMALCFAYQFSVLLPHPGLSWQAHVGGLAGGIVAGWLLRDRRAAAARARKSAVSGAKPAVAAQSGQQSPALPASQEPKTGKGFQVDPSNPRADLYKQLDDMGL